MNASRRRVSVRVGVERPAEVAVEPPRVVVVGIRPASCPTLEELFPSALVSRRGSPDTGEGVEHVRLNRGIDVEGLPGLAPQVPSLVRDAVRLVLHGGTPVVDVVLASAPGLVPWRLGGPRVFALLRPVLDDLPETTILMPDAGGPAQVGTRPAPLEERLIELATTVRAWAPVLRECWQVLLVDLPDAPPEVQQLALSSMARADVAVCAWEGPARAVERHGWRSPSALVAGRLHATDDPTITLLGEKLLLPPGRRAIPDRRRELGEVRPERAVADEIAEHVLRLRLAPDGSSAAVLGDAALRAPIGSWNLPALRVAKAIHRRIVQLAERYVFDSATPEKALLLQNAIQVMLFELEAEGVIEGEDDVQPPRCRVQAVQAIGEATLVVEVLAFLRPWLQQVGVRLSVRPGEPPKIEVR